MPTMKNATPNQCKYLWSFEIRFGKAGKPARWFEINKRGDLTKSWCIETIGVCKSWEKNKDDIALRDRVRELIRTHSPDFQFKDDVSDAPASADPQVAEKIIKQFPELNLSGDMTFDQVWDALSAAGMSEDDLQVLLDLWNDREVPEIEPVQVTGDYIKPEQFDTVLNYLKRGKNVLIYGPAGCGKSRMGKELAKAMGLDWKMISGTGGKRYSAVFGGDKLTVKNGKQVTEWQESPLLQYIQQPNFVQLEEIFSFDPDTVIGFNGLLESDMRCIETPKGLVEVDEKTVFFATANINGRSRDGNKFTGTKKQDDSLNDRFNAFRMYYSEEVERTFLSKCARSADREKIKEKLENLREKVSVSNIQFDASTRRLIEVVDAVNSGVSVDDAFEISFLNHLSKTERTKIDM